MQYVKGNPFAGSIEGTEITDKSIKLIDLDRQVFQANFIGAEQVVSGNGTFNHFVTSAVSGQVMSFVQAGAAANDGGHLKYPDVELLPILRIEWDMVVDTTNAECFWWVGVDDGTIAGNGAESVSFAHNATTTIIGRTITGSSATDSADLSAFFTVDETAINELMIVWATIAVEFLVDSVSRASSATNIPSGELPFLQAIDQQGTGTTAVQRIGCRALKVMP